MDIFLIHSLIQGYLDFYLLAVPTCYCVFQLVSPSRVASSGHAPNLFLWFYNFVALAESLYLSEPQLCSYSTE